MRLLLTCSAECSETVGFFSKSCGCCDPFDAELGVEDATRGLTSREPPGSFTASSSPRCVRTLPRERDFCIPLFDACTLPSSELSTLFFARPVADSSPTIIFSAASELPSSFVRGLDDTILFFFVLVFTGDASEREGSAELSEGVPERVLLLFVDFDSRSGKSVAESVDLDIAIGKKRDTTKDCCSGGKQERKRWHETRTNTRQERGWKMTGPEVQ